MNDSMIVLLLYSPKYLIYDWVYRFLTFVTYGKNEEYFDRGGILDLTCTAPASHFTPG